jgi:hypothetical protein
VRSAQRSVQWEIYIDADTGFTFKYPSQYIVEAQPAPTGEWGSRTLLTLDDKPKIKPTSVPRGIPMTVGVQKQSVVASGKIYHTIAEYQQSGRAAMMVQGVSNPNGELVTVNGSQALLYHYPRSDMTGLTTDGYFFIKDDLIYDVGMNPDDQYKNEILQSISWSK